MRLNTHVFNKATPLIYRIIRKIQSCNTEDSGYNEPGRKIRIVCYIECLLDRTLEKVRELLSQRCLFAYIWFVKPRVRYKKVRCIEKIYKNFVKVKRREVDFGS